MATTMPTKGAINMKAAIFTITESLMTVKEAHFAMAAPANPPMRVWEEDEGIPSHQVNRFHVMAATSPEKMMGRVMNSAITVFETVSAIPNPPIRYLAMKKATKLNVAAHKTA